MTRVSLWTSDAVYEGEVELTKPGGREARFLDVLRNPQLVGGGAIGAAPSLSLTDVQREARPAGGRRSLPGAVHLRPATIVAGYDLVPPGRGPSAAPVYEGRAATATARVLVCLEGNLQAEGTVAGGVRSLDGVRAATFVALTEVLLVDAARARQAQLPFVAVNTARIESYAILDEGGEEAPEEPGAAPD